MKVGSGLDRANDLGALVSVTERDKVADLVDSARADGATVVTGGTASERGAFYAPTLLTGVKHGTRITSTGIFSPVAPVVPPRSFEVACGQCVLRQWPGAIPACRLNAAAKENSER